MKAMRRINGERGRLPSAVRSRAPEMDDADVVQRRRPRQSPVKTLTSAAVDAVDALTTPNLHEIGPIGFFTLDRMGRICEINEKGAQLLGFSTSWLLGRPFIVFVERQDVVKFLGFLRESRRRPEQTDVGHVRLYGPGTVHPVQLTLSTTSRNSIMIHRLSIVEMAAERETEHLLEKSLANWQLLIHNVPEAIMTVDYQGRITFLNRPVWGASPKKLIGQNVLDRIPEVERPKVLRCLDQVFTYNARTACEITGVNDDWDRWYNLKFSQPHAADQLVPSWLTTTTTTTTTTIVIREISEQKQTEKRLRTSGEEIREFAARLEGVREEERTRVAREIHDELGQALTILKLDLSWVQSRIPAAAATRRKMKEIIAHVDDTIERVRRISSELRPAILDDLGLIPAIEWQIGEFRKRTGIRTRVISKAEGLALPRDTAAAVFRVVQEALTNVMRHAEASRLQVELKLKDHEFRISIQDNGVGMKRSAESGLSSLGILGMKERIIRLGGHFNIVSEPGQGTQLDIAIPAQHD